MGFEKQEVKLSKQNIKKYNLDEKQEYIEINLSDGLKLLPKTVDLEKIYLELTTECNLDCITCIRNSWSDKIGHMKDEVLNNILGELKKLPDLKTVQLGGFGEPTTHPKFMEVVKRVKAAGLELELITNGHFLNSEIVDKLIELKVDKIITSVDAPTEEKFEDIRLNADYDILLDNLNYLAQRKQELKAVKPKLWFEFVAMKNNYQLLPNLVKLATELSVESVLVTNLLPYTSDMTEQILYGAEDKEIKLGDGSGAVYLKAQFPEMELRTIRNCNFIEDKSLSVSWQGDVVPCYPLLHNYNMYIYGREKENQSYSFGKIPSESLAEIWTKKEYMHFRSKVRNEKFPSCTDCKYLDGCSMAEDNSLDCWGNSPSCADCLWYRGIIVCP
ncbi:MAG: tungsten cofactor oxidoreductase radical SAM maturase [Bacillota bacterium]